MAWKYGNCGMLGELAHSAIRRADPLQQAETPMSADRPAPASIASPEEPALPARCLVRLALKGVLATLGHRGHPYASLVLIATDADATPTSLASRLARLTGGVRPAKNPTALRGFPVRHTYAQACAGLPDFARHTPLPAPRSGVDPDGVGLLHRNSADASSSRLLSGSPIWPSLPSWLSFVRPVR